MAKKAKVELTLEELQAQKGKRQRGWVRFCAIVLSIALTLGIFGLASKNGPKVVKVYPNVVRPQTQTVVQKQDSEPTTEPTEDESVVTPPATDEEGGGLLDTLLGLLGGIDFGAIAGMIDLDGLGVSIAGGIQNFKDFLLNIVDKVEGSISGKPAITHDPVEQPFDAGMELGEEKARQELVSLLAEATKEGVGYTVTRNAAYQEGGNVSIGAQTEALNDMLSKLPAPDGQPLSLDSIVGSFAGIKADGSPITFAVKKGETAAQMVEKGDLDAAYEKYALKPITLTAEDIAIVSADDKAGQYSFRLKDVADPNRRADCGLNRFTNDFLVQNEIAATIKNAGGATQVSVSPLKLTDYETRYTDVLVAVQVDPQTKQLKSMSYTYNTYAKFTVRTNTVQIVGAASTVTQNTYSGFVY